MEGDVFDAQGLDLGQVGARGESAIEARLPWGLAVQVLLSLHHVYGQRRVGRIALLDHRVRDQTGSAAGQAELVAVQGVAVVLDDDVGVGLEDGYELFAGGDLLVVEDAGLRMRRSVW